MGIYSYVKWKNAILVKFNESFSFVLTQKKQKVKTLKIELKIKYVL
ncbi:hypothetical protein HMPREF0204_14751 [Chryseobacterium gleum ATCC 35910]|uniref:Uncharacterized protein n=1 Tax=Chryseobacterium gleum ATCC 35910 TaxID=525257 RepID=A0ABN0ARJ7_CHRGE|nr:hypothetical protein HMPREF0204_14751 [Chryseobacterium gleum ATCC 35910]